VDALSCWPRGGVDCTAPSPSTDPSPSALTPFPAPRRGRMGRRDRPQGHPPDPQLRGEGLPARPPQRAPLRLFLHLHLGGARPGGQVRLCHLPQRHAGRRPQGPGRQVRRARRARLYVRMRVSQCLRCANATGGGGGVRCAKKHPLPPPPKKTGMPASAATASTAPASRSAC
jgi:hypothetical protein